MTTDPNELVNRWRKWAIYFWPHVFSSRVNDCADELESALAWHPMTVEPKGGEGVEVAMEIDDSDTRIIEWLGENRWGNLSWAYWSKQYPNATWCYLPRRTA